MKSKDQCDSGSASLCHARQCLVIKPGSPTDLDSDAHRVIEVTQQYPATFPLESQALCLRASNFYPSLAQNSLAPNNIMWHR